MDELFKLEESQQTTLKALVDAIESEESEPQVLNIPHLLQVMQAFQQLRSIAGEDWYISYSLHEPYTSMGTINLEAAEFTFESMQSLNQILSNASNVEIYPLENSRLRMSITFHGITKRML